ncbi:protein DETOXIFICATION 27-like [Juglans microcarpa x Juglans regia]|uniref:protein DETOXIFICATION 27-like n=1 Tax=Juglans microcarpa x Juglans regia TaxID=2249226 RepID=UPI001B7EDE2A|nr:protein DETOXIFICATION 27-like [Juglans microcarpa x Juglans regia]XP_040997455.1 protein DETOXIFICATION 27-like [Juglans microcarpa x Juglans regia]
MGVRKEDEEPLLVSGPQQNEQEEEEEQERRREGNAGDLVRQTWLESKKMWAIAGPSIFSRLAMFSMTVITQSFAGHLSDLDLAAISIASTVIIAFTFGFLLGMASALETLCGQAYGAGQYHMLGIYLQRSWIVLFLFSLLLLPMFVFATPILKLLGQSDAVAEESGVVAMWLIPMHLSFPFQFTLQRFLQCQLKTGVIAWISGGTLAVHVFVSWLFVYKLSVGIVGTALTLDFSWWLSALGLFGYAVCGGCPHSWTGFSAQGLSGLWEFFKLSVASGVMLALENFYYRILIIVSGYFHKTEVAVDALSICITIFAWESMIPLGFLAATGVRVANELGAGNAKGAKFATTVSVLTSLVVGHLFWSIMMGFHEKLAMIFTSSPSVIAMVNELAVLLAFTILVNCIQPVLSGVAVGAGWQAVVAFINIGSYYLVGVPLAVFLGWLLPSGITSIWSGMICGTVVQTLILTVITLRFEWEKEAQKAQIHITNEVASNN